MKSRNPYWPPTPPIPPILFEEEIDVLDEIRDLLPRREVPEDPSFADMLKDNE